MTIADSFKIAINGAFRHSVFRNREYDYMLRTLGAKVHGSDNMLLIPPIQDIQINTLDLTHDEITFTYDDYTFKCVFTWKCTLDGYVFVKCE